MKVFEHDINICMGWLLGIVLLTACSQEEEAWTDDTWPTVQTSLTFSIPQRIVGESKSPVATRMGGDEVQVTEDVAGFRGLEDLTLLCFEEMPREDNRKIGQFLHLPSVTAASLHGPAKTNYSIFRNLNIPEGTTHVAFYARAHNALRDGNPTPDDLATYGALSASGLSSGQYASNADIRFSPVSICQETSAMSNNTTGQQLLNLLNSLMTTTGSESAPNDQWSTSTNTTLKEAYGAMTQLTTASSFNVQAMLNHVYHSLKTIPEAVDGGQLAQQIIQKIIDASVKEPASAEESITLKDTYQGFPADLHLPAGAARLSWNATSQSFQIADVQDYGKQLQVPSLDRYVYPAALYYNVFSEVAASDTVKLVEAVNCDSWAKVIDSLYHYASGTVQSSTKSTAVVKQLQYAVGRIDARVTMESGNFYDAYGKLVDVSEGFTITGYIVGGQHQANYDFKPIKGTDEMFIYDSKLSGTQRITDVRWTDTNYILGLETPSDENVLLALELVNNGKAFQGADGQILPGATFYLVADLQPSTAKNYNQGQLDQIFRKDYVTKVNLSVLKGWPDKDGDGVPDPDLDKDGNPQPMNGLGTATNGLPTLNIPEASAPTLGLSVDLSWEKGSVFNIAL